ncbi:MAG: S-methyl-5-thioribose-1-phosphate isomerase [Abditibacteriota bacterium]|nr:S-methyl-5-thioribose-1-phosphate isomerase [Abditibacteriota bacterium]
MERTVDYDGARVKLIDQRLLPAEFKLVYIDAVDDMAFAIKDMIVRGAPAIGVAAALGVVLGAKNSKATDKAALMADIDSACETLKNTRPTAVNLFWGIDRMRDVAAKTEGSVADIIEAMEAEGRAMLDADEAACRALGAHGAELLPDECVIMTICNAGALATVAYGTALGVIRAAAEAGKKVKVFSLETRPRLQGMKLTCYELMADGIDVTCVSDGMAGSVLRSKGVNAVVVGADRIAANGDTANKIGTYSLAVEAKYHNVPFYVAAPVSTIDFNLESGGLIPIEERAEEEMTALGGTRIAPEGLKVYNPAFDVTPAELITAIVTEKGVVKSPNAEKMAVLK